MAEEAMSAGLNLQLSILQEFDRFEFRMVMAPESPPAPQYPGDDPAKCNPETRIL
jgi:hypothetical protein